MPRHAWLLAPPAIVLAVLFLLPMGLVLQAAGDPAAWAWVVRDYPMGVLGNAARQATLSTLLTLALAVPLAWLHHARRVPGRDLLLAAHAVPFVMPAFVVVYGLRDTIGPHGWLAARGGPDLLSAFGPIGAVVLAHAYYNHGFAARYLHAALDARPHRLEDAAATLGASRPWAFLRVTLPVLAPAVGAVALLVFLFCFASFGTVLLLGQAGAVQTLETLLFSKLNSLFPDHAQAAVLGILQLAVNATLLGAYLWLRRRQAPLPRGVERAAPRAGRAATTTAWLLAAAATLPLLAVLAGGFRVGGTWTLAPWQDLLSGPQGFDLGRAIALSVGYAVLATLAALALCAGIAYGARRLPPWARRAIEAAASLPMAASSSLVGLGFILAFGAGTAIPIPGTFLIVLLAHTVLVLPFVARAVLPAFASRDTRLEDAASTLGAPDRGVALRVHWPLLRGPLLVATGFGIAMSLGDFGASTLLARADTQGLAVWTNELGGGFDPLLRARGTALAGALGALALGAFILVERAGRTKEQPL